MNDNIFKDRLFLAKRIKVGFNSYQWVVSSDDGFELHFKQSIIGKETDKRVAFDLAEILNKGKAK